MYYEIYIDSLFLVNFIMNLYLLLIVNRSVHRTATRLRLILGAAVGAAVYFIPFLLEGAVWLKLAAGMAAGSCLMILAAFPVRNVKAFLQIFERLVLVSFLVGGGMLFLIKRVPLIGKYMRGIQGVMGLGACLYLLVTHFQEKKLKENHICRIILNGRDGKMKIAALIDSGNSLVEPISGKPVSVIDSTVFHGLWEEPPGLFRMIPYHSIGKRRGMLKGYLLPEIQIETEGVIKTCRDVYVAVSEESITGDAMSLRGDADGGAAPVKMIVNPMLLKC